MDDRLYVSLVANAHNIVNKHGEDLNDTEIMMLAQHYLSKADSDIDEDLQSQDDLDEAIEVIDFVRKLSLFLLETSDAYLDKVLELKEQKAVNKYCFLKSRLACKEAA